MQSEGQWLHPLASALSHQAIPVWFRPDGTVPTLGDPKHKACLMRSWTG